MTLTERLQAARAGSRELSDEFLIAMAWHKRDDKTLGVAWCKPGSDVAVLNRPDPTRDMNAVLAMAGEYDWIMARGCCTEDEPPYGIQLIKREVTREPASIVSEAEGINLCCVACAALLQAKGADNE